MIEPQEHHVSAFQEAVWARCQKCQGGDPSKIEKCPRPGCQFYSFRLRSVGGVSLRERHFALWRWIRKVGLLSRRLPRERSPGSFLIPSPRSEGGSGIRGLDLPSQDLSMSLVQWEEGREGVERGAGVGSTGPVKGIMSAGA